MTARFPGKNRYLLIICQFTQSRVSSCRLSGFFLSGPHFNHRKHIFFTEPTKNNIVGVSNQEMPLTTLKVLRQLVANSSLPRYSHSLS